MEELVALGVQLSLLLIVLSIGLQARWSDLTYALKRPGSFLLVSVVITPLYGWWASTKASTHSDSAASRNGGAAI